jgi:hypothetical protein
MRSIPESELPTWEWPSSAEECALAAELRELDRSSARADEDRWGPADIVDLDVADDLEHGAGVGDVEVIAWILDHGVDPWSSAMLACIDPETLLDPIDRVRYLQAYDAVGHYVVADQQRALVAVAGRSPCGDLTLERHIEHEVAIARRTSRGRAGRDIEVARSLRAEFRDTAGALERGEITLEHASALVAGTRHVASAEARAEVEARVLPQAPGCSPTTFRKHVDAAVCAVDAADEARRHARAKGDRQVWVRRIGNGLGELHVVDEWPVVNAMYERITDKATNLQRERRAQWRAAAEAATDPESIAAEPFDDGWVDRTLDNCRADALSDLVLRDDPEDVAVGVEADDGNGDAPTADDAEGTNPGGARRRARQRRRKPRIEGRLVIDLATLRGEAENPCQLDGSPIPATIGRRLARDIAHWRRMVTDPVEGHLLDYGRRSYLPDRLRTFVAERDQTCRNPWCDQPAHRGQLDHATAYPHGPSDTANTGTLCTDCHTIKTTRGAYLDDSAPDGSAVWRTAWGQTVPIAPTRYLDNGGSSNAAPPEPQTPATTVPTTRLATIPGMLDRIADSPPPRTFTPPAATGRTPPF